MTTTAELRYLWRDYFGAEAKLRKSTAIKFPGTIPSATQLVADPAAEAFTIFAALMSAHGYLYREASGGTWVVRYIAGTDEWSLHSYGIALDLNPEANNPITCETDMPASFIIDVLALETNNGKAVFAWGGHWGDDCDPMHFQIDCAPADLETGIKDYDDDEGGFMAGIDFCAKGDKGPKVRYWQRVLNALGADLTVDGDYGPKTVRAVKDAVGEDNDGQNIDSFEAFQLHKDWIKSLKG